MAKGEKRTISIVMTAELKETNISIGRHQDEGTTNEDAVKVNLLIN